MRGCSRSPRRWPREAERDPGREPHERFVGGTLPPWPPGEFFEFPLGHFPEPPRDEPGGVEPFRVVLRQERLALAFEERAGLSFAIAQRAAQVGFRGVLQGFPPEGWWLRLPSYG
jgi:hypothetical protein